MNTATNGDIELAYETFGTTGRPLLLIQGASAPMIGWHDEFCAALVERGFHVARFDNRDAGRSSRARKPYTLTEMAADGIAVLDALGWPGAHLVGVSLGGMIAQVMATRHAERVLSLTSMSSAPDPSVRWSRRTTATLVKFFAATARKPAGPEAAEEKLLKVFRILGSTGYPHDEKWIRKIARDGFEHRTDFAAAKRQARAARASGDRRTQLAKVEAPTLVITGKADPVQPVRAGRATADAIPGARLVIYPGMGHDLPRDLWPTIVEEIHAVATKG
ncbi:alpha/beta fold hydrolase [Amycolatopsis sp. CA-230715]|uniref:alpha/beta fold hydrolase n=1 Tax=Amycolatopsis sp. CA-230715 TaxID=2745196 RepID=UPI001C0392DD|nr:alpha/beta hydrolase [Amycolatopsis sp. CA-230715]QWF82208.1 Aclacinomycin methylesterase RdmC [Amycolatopsis sp. CA-230715]